MTLGTKTFCLMTLGINTLGIKTLGILKFGILIFWHNDKKQNGFNTDAERLDNQHTNKK